MYLVTFYLRLKNEFQPDLWLGDLADQPIRGQVFMAPW